MPVEPGCTLAKRLEPGDTHCKCAYLGPACRLSEGRLPESWHVCGCWGDQAHGNPSAPRLRGARQPDASLNCVMRAGMRSRCSCATRHDCPTAATDARKRWRAHLILEPTDAVEHDRTVSTLNVEQAVAARVEDAHAHCAQAKRSRHRGGNSCHCRSPERSVLNSKRYRVDDCCAPWNRPVPQATRWITQPGRSVSSTSSQ